MIKEQLIQARNLIKQKRYDDARAILQTIDHPTAKEWLSKLNHLASPPVSSPAQPPAPALDSGEAAPLDTNAIKAEMLKARDLIMQKNYDDARTVLEQIDHPTAKEWLDKLATLVTAQRAPTALSTPPPPEPSVPAAPTAPTAPTASSAPAALPEAAMPDLTGVSHDDILRQAQKALLMDQYDKARELLAPLKTPEAAFWLEKTGMTRFRSYENIWLDMFQYALPPKAIQYPARWKCPICKRSADQALACPQRDQDPCPVKINTRAIEEPRRLALLLQALYLDQQQDVEKILIHIDSARLAHWKTELEWQRERMNQIDVRRAVVEEAILLLEQFAKMRQAEAPQSAAQEPNPANPAPPAPRPARLGINKTDADLSGAASSPDAKRAALPQLDTSLRPSVQVQIGKSPREKPLLSRIFDAIIRFFINQAV